MIVIGVEDVITTDLWFIYLICNKFQICLENHPCTEEYYN